MSKRARQELLALIAFAVAMACLSVLIVRAVWAHDQHPVETVPVYKDWRPDLSKCPDNVDKWECMRHAMWRVDI